MQRGNLKQKLFKNSLEFNNSDQWLISADCFAKSSGKAKDFFGNTLSGMFLKSNREKQNMVEKG
jgi:hypothetical protein